VGERYGDAAQDHGRAEVVHGGDARAAEDVELVQRDHGVERADGRFVHFDKRLRPSGFAVAMDTDWKNVALAE